MGPHHENPVLRPSSGDTEPQAVQIPRHLLLAAARKIVSQNSDSEVAARRLIANASDNQIDLSLLFGVLGIGKTAGNKSLEIIRQVCLIVKGAGRTTIVFLSEPPRDGDLGTPSEATADRAACLIEACQHMKSQFGDAVQVAQSLPDPRETWAIAAFDRAGFSRVGDLLYLRRPWRTGLGTVQSGFGIEGLDVLPLSSIPQSEHNAVLLAALESSYVDTLDCPELCGLRTTQDILDSHFSTGTFVPELWWLVLMHGRPSGCMLFSPIAGQRATELVYLGLAPELRGKGLSSKLLSMGIAQARAHPMLQFGFEEFTCAVDTRNIPARKIYERAGFTSFAERVAFVKTL